MDYVAPEVAKPSQTDSTYPHMDSMAANMSQTLKPSYLAKVIVNNSSRMGFHTSMVEVVGTGSVE